MSRGRSAIISLLGDGLAGPLYNEEGILYAAWIWQKSLAASSILLWSVATPGLMCFS